MPKLVPLSLDAFVVAAAFIDDVPALALGDGTVRLLDGAEPKVLAVHAGSVLAAELTRDGRGLITGGDDGKLKRVAADGSVTDLAERGRKWLDQIATGPDGALAFASGRTLWVRFADGRIEETQFPRAVGGIAFAPKGLRLAIARYDGVTLIFPGTTAKPSELTWKGMHSLVSFSPDGRFVVTAMQEPALHGWRLPDARDMRMSGYPTKVRSMSWTAKGRYLATSGAPASVMWPFTSKDGPMGKQPLELGFAQDAMVARVAAHPDEDVVALGYSTGEVRLVRVPDGAEVPVRPADGAPISALAWDANGERLLIGTEKGAAGLFDLRA
ncbi:WD40 repeat domain-containing protein [Segnochrobactraceae bacterium EtOH-i3]